MPREFKRRITRVTRCRTNYNRRIVVEFETDGRLLKLREEGRRARYPITWEQVWQSAVRLAQQRALAEKAAGRKRAKSAT